MNLLIDLVAVSALGYIAYRELPNVRDALAKTHFVDDITASLHKTVARLEDAVSHHTDMADSYLADAKMFEVSARAHQDEAANAARIADKVAALIT